MSKSKPSHYVEILDFFKNANRPHSCQGVFSTFQKNMTKSAVQKVLDRLVKDEELTEKSFGKTKIYFLNQKDAATASVDETRQMDDELNDAKKKLEQAKNTLKSKETLYVSMTAGLSNEELDTQIKIHQKRLQELKEKAEQIAKSKSKKSKDKQKEANKNKNQDKDQDKDKADDVQKENVKEIHEKLAKETRKRKRIATEIVDSILEGYPKSKKALLEEVGIDTFS